MLMSPKSTFQNCGNSSSCNFLNTFPTRVTRGSSLIKTCGPSQRFCLRSSATSASAFLRIVRNFQHRKVAPPFDWRLCPKKMGKPSSITTAKQQTSSTGDITSSTTRLIRKSAARFTDTYQPVDSILTETRAASSGENISSMGLIVTTAVSVVSQTTSGPTQTSGSRAAETAPSQSGATQRSVARSSVP